MTEPEWLSCDRLLTLLTHVTSQPEFTRRPAGRRKLRLFGCACCRHDWAQIVDERSRRAVELSERLVDQRVEPTLIHEIRTVAFEALRLAGNGTGYEARSSIALVSSPRRAAEAAYSVLDADVKGAAWGAAGVASYTPTHPHYVAWRQREREQIALLRDIIGNPFQEVRVGRAWLKWRDGTVVKLAQTAYDERELPSGHLDAARLAIVADALEEAGCTNEEMLGHLRGPGPHVRGCWAVDGLLGKD